MKSTTYLRENRLDEKNYKKLNGVPLNNSINFKGLLNSSVAIKFVNNVLPVSVSEIPPVLEKKAVKLLKTKSDNLAELYVGFKDNFIKRIKESENFRNRIGINDEVFEQIKEGKNIFIPEENLIKKFASNIFAPLRIFSDIYSFILKSRFGSWLSTKSVFVADLVKKNSDKIDDDLILRNYRSYTGLIDSIKIWESKQRKIAGLTAWENTEDLAIPTKMLESKVMRRWLKSVDPTKGKYQTKHQMLGNRLISGLIYGTYLGNDAYNITMRYSQSKEESKSQRRSRFAQEIAKIGINMYLINLFIGTFDKYVNKNLFHALFMAGATTMTAEILGRKLIGRPIFPSDKETLDEMSKKMEEKKGFWVSVGRLISGVRPKKVSENKDSSKIIILSDDKKIIPNHYTYDKKSSFKGNLKIDKNISFGSFYRVPNYMKSKNVSEILELLKKSDLKIYNSFVEIINKSLKKTNNSEDLNKILQTKDFIEIGTKKTFAGNLVKSLASPYFFIKNLSMNIAKGVKKTFNKTSTVLSLSEMKEKLVKLKSENPEIEQEYANFLDNMLKTKLWKKSGLDKDVKETKILEEFLDALKKDTEEIEGVKNILIFLDKHLKSRDLTDENVKKMKDLLFKNFMKTDGASHVEYDGNTFAMMNINLARAITTLFLVVDAYNLSIQYSNNDKSVAVNNGKSRALQEVSRITVSAYMLAFVHNLLSKFCNSSLFGAFATTALTSSVNDTIARKVVGVPIGAKTYEQLVEIDNQNAKSKSPLKRTLAYLIGKRQKNQMSSNSTTKKDSEFSLAINNNFKIMLD